MPEAPTEQESRQIVRWWNSWIYAWSLRIEFNLRRNTNRLYVFPSSYRLSDKCHKSTSETNPRLSLGLKKHYQIKKNKTVVLFIISCRLKEVLQLFVMRTVSRNSYRYLSATVCPDKNHISVAKRQAIIFWMIQPLRICT